MLRTVGCDVVRHVDAIGRFVLFDGRRLAFGHAAFAAAILAFVLHHATDSCALLREARRITGGAVLVLEDTPHAARTAGKGVR